MQDSACAECLRRCAAQTTGLVMVAVTCTAEDEAEVMMWREGQGSDDMAYDEGSSTIVGEPALHQTIQV